MSALVPVLLLLAACSTERRHRALSFFLDGVPPLHPVTAALPLPGSPSAPPGARQWTPSVHKPYTDFECATCHNIGEVGQAAPHNPNFVRLQPEQGLCTPCHKGMPGSPRFAHAPVLLSACLWCHQSHDSPYPALLRDAPERVCFRCHTEAEISTGDHHRRPFATSERSCIDCHTAHGGERRFFLKADPDPAPGATPAVSVAPRPPAEQQALGAPPAKEQTPQTEP